MPPVPRPRSSSSASRARALRAPRRAAAALVALLSACVIPIGPEFREPEPNHPPALVSASPQAGENAPGTSEFNILVSDANLGDTLHVRWFYDYPPFSRLLTRRAPGADEILPPPRDGNPVRALRAFRPSCVAHNVAPGLPTHQLLLLVADRPFAPPAEASERYPYHAVSEGGALLAVSWTLALDCTP